MVPDFSKTLLFLLDFFNHQNIDYALIGGFALNAYGRTRQTDDIDFLLRDRDARQTVDFLESLGYRTLNRSAAFSNHEHLLAGFSRVDFLYVNGATADSLFQEVREFPVLGHMRVRVVKPEHLIALKLFSLTSNPERSALDREDLVHLLRQKNLNREEVEKYLLKYSMADLLPYLEGKNGT